DNLFLAEHIQSGTDWIEQVVSRLTRKVYITIDLDVFDPSIMPSTGTPEPGGLLWYPVLNLLKRVAERNHIVGFDVVELCPAENNKAPDFLAAKLVYKLLSYKYCLTD
ncbi:MAG TPA: arginase family protein, partial [Bacteroidales bacterium]|nr:arginase family protein [Bacteroidales bacterium]